MNAVEQELDRLRLCFLAEMQVLDRALDLIRGLNASVSLLLELERWGRERDEPILVRMD
jgi:hypothetical protein